MEEEVRKKQKEKNTKQRSQGNKKLKKTDSIKRKREKVGINPDKNKEKTDFEKRKTVNRGISDKNTSTYTSDKKKNIKKYPKDNKSEIARDTDDRNKDLKRSNAGISKNSGHKKKIYREKNEIDSKINKYGNKSNINKTDKKPIRGKRSLELKKQGETKSDNKKKIKEAGIIGAVLILMVLIYNIFGRSYMDRMERNDFINTMEPMAVELYEEYGILPSITISQSAIESNWGQSKLSKKGFNLFELKADDSWNGGTINLYTKEDNNKSGEVEYRKYGSYKEALYDHVEYILSDEKYKESALFNSEDYRKQAEVLEKYEKTNENSDKKIYDDIIVDTIEKYNLDEIDRKYK